MITDFSSFPDYSQKFPEAYDSRFFNLDRFRKFLDACGIPTKVPAILIAGSKGKGTTAHILSRLLTAQGKKTGLFTSPYLYDVREMIRLDGRMIPRKDFADITREIFRKAKNFPGLTTFEILTATALRYFSQKKADFFVMEVGLGGLLDAVNVVTPIATVLTMVEREHADILGGTLLKIIRAKLGITRPGVPLFLGKQKKHVHELILKELRECKVPLFDIGRDFSLRVLAMTEKGTHFQVTRRFSQKKRHSLCSCLVAEAGALQQKRGSSNGLKDSETFFLGLHGEAAGWNALTAVVVANVIMKRETPEEKRAMREHCHPERPKGAKDLSLSYHRKRLSELDPSVVAHFRDSLRMTVVPLRLLRRQKQRRRISLRFMCALPAGRQARNDSVLPGHFEIRNLPNGKKLILDVLHTPESARNFRQTLEHVFPDRPYVFITAFLQDKNIPAILKHLIRPSDSIFFPKISHPRAESPSALYKFFIQKFPKCSCQTDNLSKIFQKIAQSDCQQKIFCLIGSHYLLREAKKLNFLS